MNEMEPEMGRAVIKPWDKRLDGIKYLESDADEQLVIYIPLTGVVRLHSLLIRSTADDSAPKTIKLFKNRQDIDFSLASELQALAEVEHPENTGGEVGDSLDDEAASSAADLEREGIVEYSLNRAHFSNLTSLTIFIESNYGADTTKILYIGLRGEWANVNRGAPVVTLYEAAANPKDHKNLVPGETPVDEQA